MSETAGMAMEGPSAGTLLRRAREAAGLHVAALAVSLKVPVRKLEALEEDRVDLLPDAVFARALASSVCRTLKIDPRAVLERLPQSAAPRLVPERESINAPFRAPGDAIGPTWRDQLTRPVFLTVAALLLGALVLLLLPLFERAPGSEPVAAASGQPAPADNPAPAPQAAVLTVPAVPVTEVPPVAGGAIAPAAASTGAEALISVVTSPASVSASEAMPPSTSAQAAAATGLVVFRASGPSWVQVVDAKGAVPLRRLLAAGESAGASGALPLSITVGSAASTEVLVRGKPFELAPMARDNVARFEVK